MLIDSDFDKKTGFEGIDYKLEISWDNQTGQWTKKLVQWSVNGDQRILNITKNYSRFSENGKIMYCYIWIWDPYSTLLNINNILF
jgi:hypothetical protein